MKYISICFLFLFISCSLPTPQPRPPECGSAAACGSLYTASRNDCDNNRRTDKKAIVSNRSSNKRIYFLIEFWQTKMYQNWPGQRTFIESKLFLIEPKSTWEISCVFGGELPDDNEWIRNDWKLIKKCFADDPDCPALKNPSTPSPNPIDCGPNKECIDEEKNYCLEMNICNTTNQLGLIGNDLYRLNEALLKANMAVDNLDMQAIIPNLYKNCERENFIIKNQKFQFNGSMCELGFQINHPKFENLYLKLSSTLEGKIRTHNQGLKYPRLIFDDEHKAPLILLENQNGEVVEETVIEISITKNQLFLNTSSDRCIRIDFCYRPGMEG